MTSTKQYKSLQIHNGNKKKKICFELKSSLSTETDWMSVFVWLDAVVGMWLYLYVFDTLTINIWNVMPKALVKQKAERQKKERKKNSRKFPIFHHVSEYSTYNWRMHEDHTMLQTSIQFTNREKPTTFLFSKRKNISAV